MGYRPPKGIRPPQPEGKRTGRPKGSRKGWHNLLQKDPDIERDIRWAYHSCFVTFAKLPTPPSALALTLSKLAASFPEEYKRWVKNGCRVLNDL